MIFYIRISFKKFMHLLYASSSLTLLSIRQYLRVILSQGQKHSDLQLAFTNIWVKDAIYSYYISITSVADSIGGNKCSKRCILINTEPLYYDKTTAQGNEISH